MKLYGVVMAMLFAGDVLGSTCELEFDNGSIITGVELAVSAEDMAKGLSGRSEAGQGMLFSWDKAGYRAVWMKDTLIPLSAAYIGFDGVVLAIVDLEPMSEEYRWSLEPATDVLELAVGRFEELGIKPDSVLIRRDCIKQGL